MDKSLLFSNIEPSDVPTLLKCLNAQNVSYKKGETIIAADEPVSRFGVVLSGSVLVVQDDFWGNRSVVARIVPVQMFGEALSFSGGIAAPVSVEAAERCDALLLDSSKLFNLCSNACEFHTRLVQNVMQSLAVKNIALMRKISHISKRTIRDKLLSYLSERSEEADSATFTIPYDRQQLADFLAVDRSALSAVLSSLRRDGVIEYTKNRFTLL